MFLLLILLGFRAVLSMKDALAVSPVCDSYDLFNSIENIICKQLKPLLRERGEKGSHYYNRFIL